MLLWVMCATVNRKKLFGKTPKKAVAGKYVLSELNAKLA